MLLGAGELGKEVLIALQRLSVETIEDRYDNAPGQQVAHHAHTITMSDPRQLKALEVAGTLRGMSSSGKGQSKIDGPPDVQKK